MLATTVTLDDPQLIADNVDVALEDVKCLALRLKVSEGVSSCQVFWSTTAQPEMSADKCFVFALKPDGGWHTYQVSKKVEGAWAGLLKILRLDIGAPGDRIEIDWIRLYGNAP